jgi:hypothetical protein
MRRTATLYARDVGLRHHSGPVYRLGSRVLRLGSLPSSDSLATLAGPILEEISAAAGMKFARRLKAMRSSTWREPPHGA